MTDGVFAQPDGLVVAAVLAGDREQFAILVQRYRLPLLRAAYSRLGRHEGAEDAVQEAFLNAFKSLHTYNSQYSFRTWLWTILLNQCHRHYRQQTRGGMGGPGPEGREADLAGGQPAASRLRSAESPADQLIANERAARLQALLDQLPEVQADALRLRFFGGLKFREIAHAMDCSLSTAKNRVRWGLNNMADQLGPTEISSRRPTAESCHESADEL